MGAGSLFLLKLLIASILLLASMSTPAASLKFRAREHFDQHYIRVHSKQYRYGGFSNTINLFYEQPYSYSIGLAIGPLPGMAFKEQAPDPEQLGERFYLILGGMEYKFFPFDWFPIFFARLGAGASYLKSRGLYNDLRGRYGYLGAGLEIPVGGVGIALEIAVRRSELEEKLRINTFTPSLGFHFYGE